MRRWWALLYFLRSSSAIIRSSTIPGNDSATRARKWRQRPELLFHRVSKLLFLLREGERALQLAAKLALIEHSLLLDHPVGGLAVQPGDEVTSIVGLECSRSVRVRCARAIDVNTTVEVLDWSLMRPNLFGISGSSTTSAASTRAQSTDTISLSCSTLQGSEKDGRPCGCYVLSAARRLMVAMYSGPRLRGVADAFPR